MPKNIQFVAQRRCYGERIRIPVARGRRMRADTGLGTAGLDLGTQRRIKLGLGQPQLRARLLHLGRLHCNRQIVLHRAVNQPTEHGVLKALPPMRHGLVLGLATDRSRLLCRRQMQVGPLIVWHQRTSRQRHAHCSHTQRAAGIHLRGLSHDSCPRSCHLRALVQSLAFPDQRFRRRCCGCVR